MVSGECSVCTKGNTGFLHLTPGYMKRNSQRLGRKWVGCEVEVKDSKLGGVRFLCSLSHLCGTEWLMWI